MDVAEKATSFQQFSGSCSRTDSKTVVLHKPTPLPVAWWICGLEGLGEGFSVSQDAGIIGPCSEFGMRLCFEATKVDDIKKTFQVEVSDAVKLLGIVQVESIQVFVEAYDIGLDINISTGRGYVDFGALKVLGEAKQVLTLKNRGKYEIVYSFKLEAADTNIPDLASHFTVHPQKGMLASSGDSMHVHLLFHPKREMSIEDKAILQCQVIDPSISEGDEIAAVIPIRVSGKAVCSKYSISPASLINFGVVLKGTRKTRTFTLENKGVLAFKFHICRMPPKPSAHQLQSVQSCMSEDTRTNAVLAKKSKCLLQQDAGPVIATRFTLGMFTVYPGFGSIPPGGLQTVTVECRAATLGKCEEHLSIDIQGRAPTDNPLGIPYTLFAESCFPAFVVDDIESIFEEHRICGNKKLYQSLQTLQDKGVFITDENRFVFTIVVVGHQAEARFRICNMNKVPCNVVLSVKPISTQDSEQSLLEGLHPLPRTEIEFWHTRTVALQCVNDQLLSPRAMEMAEVLEKANSCYWPMLQSLLRDVSAGLEEATDVGLHLQQLRILLEKLEQANYLQLQPCLDRVLCAVCLLPAHCQYYSSPARVIMLLRNICNLLIEMVEPQGWRQLQWEGTGQTEPPPFPPAALLRDL
ncbi:hydrocephalus-inducing protein homolog [Cuculus canorus]|uniref:hydrocephalus-inducing protein homolog n=1 Tax=Cuculus canorus TaxID=55661 RepID=UPI0023AACB2F|nr:hydrocephalus-inducing protein homolog [Cuculus canorus]